MGIPPYSGAAEWGSDVAVDVLRALDVEYVTLNPGSSYRGLRDSLVNYGGNQRPEMILCCHEEIAVAVAHGYYKATGKLAVAIIGDGDFLMGPAALWTAAHYQLPLLLVIHNNRTYYNDEEHQEVLARVRGRPVENAWIGMRLEQPASDLAGLARDLGGHGEGPITHAAELAPALARAAEVVRRGGMALVDVVSKPR